MAHTHQKIAPGVGGRQGRFAGYCLVIKTQLSLSVEYVGKDFAHHILAGCIILQKYPGQLVHPQIMLLEELFYRFFVYLHYFIFFCLYYNRILIFLTLSRIFFNANF